MTPPLVSDGCPSCGSRTYTGYGLCVNEWHDTAPSTVADISAPWCCFIHGRSHCPACHQEPT